MKEVDWLLDGDPAIRRQVMRDPTDAAPDQSAAELRRVEHEGWGARLPALEDSDELWDRGPCDPASYREESRANPGP